MKEWETEDKNIKLRRFKTGKEYKAAGFKAFFIEKTYLGQDTHRTHNGQFSGIMIITKDDEFSGYTILTDKTLPFSSTIKNKLVQQTIYDMHTKEMHEEYIRKNAKYMLLT